MKGLIRGGLLTLLRRNVNIMTPSNLVYLIEVFRIHICGYRRLTEMPLVLFLHFRFYFFCFSLSFLPKPHGQYLGVLFSSLAFEAFSLSNATQAAFTRPFPIVFSPLSCHPFGRM
jgi:hypothetical protein